MDKKLNKFLPPQHQQQIFQISSAKGQFEYNIKDVLGKGSFGTVYKGKEQTTKKTVAIKVLEKKLINSDQYLYKSLEQEIYFMMQLKSENIVKLIDYQENDDKYYVILEYCNNASLFDTIKTNGKLPENQAIQILFDILKGFKELINKDIIHRDLKPDNIMIHDGTSKITDFGFSRYVENFEDNKMTTSVGTPLYMSPQTLQQQQYSTKCDIWSLGVIYYEILYGTPPWNARSTEELISNIKNRKLLFPFSVKVSELSIDFIKKALIYDEEKRMSWADVYKHPVLQGFFDDFEVILKDQQNNNQKIEIKQSKIQQIDKNINENYYTNEYIEYHFENFIKKIQQSILENYLQLDKLFTEWNIKINKVYDKKEFFSFLDKIDKQDSEIKEYIFKRFDIVGQKKVNFQDLMYWFQKGQQEHPFDDFIDNMAYKIIEGLQLLAIQMEIYSIELIFEIQNESIFQVQHFSDLLNQIGIKLPKKEIQELYDVFGKNNENVLFIQFQQWIAYYAIKQYITTQTHENQNQIDLKQKKKSDDKNSKLQDKSKQQNK